MVKWNLWSYVFILTTLSVSSSNLQTGLGMKIGGRSKRMTEDDRQMVTIDLSALRPSLPGLVLYKYGEVAPKLVQVDLSALNPQLQPHVIWPQFDQMELISDRSFDFDSMDNIPYLTGEESLISPKHQRADKMSMAEANSWSQLNDLTDSDIYDFIPDSRRNDELMSLQGSLPLAEEVIVPLDWEEKKSIQNSEKRNILMFRGGQPGEHTTTESTKEKFPENTRSGKVSQESSNVHYTPFGATNWIPGKRKHMHETESEEKEDANPSTTELGKKKNVFISSGWGPGGQQVAMTAVRGQGTRRRTDNKPQSEPVRISSQESWAMPRQYWNVPHLLAGHWQQ